MTSSEILLFVKEEVAKYDDGKPSSLVIQAIREACLNLVSSKAAEAPGGQDASKVIAAARCIKHWHDHIYKNGDEGMVVSGEHVRELWGALAEYDRLAPAAPSERADEILKESPVKFQHNGFEHQVDRMAQYVIDTHPGTSLAAAYRAVCEELANRAQARAGLSSQEGK